ncbi:MAG TPA: HAD family hydrolase [Candidatus Elarobacter sp.]|jgi:FMN phosphatase YigB (HAD superfamily)|nr:HAD family hydrolase [Candidatus Elarobacter sp.]
MIAIGFDFDHTLGVDNGLERKAMYAYAAELHRPLDPHDPTWLARINELLANFRAGDMTMDDMLARFTTALAADTPPNADRWRDICYSLVDPLVRPIDHARELLTTLQARAIPTAVLTNGWTPLQQKKIARALGPDIASTIPILVSDALHAYKPDPAAFAALADTLRTPRQHTWYVGDNPRGDIAGALAAGLRAAWFDWENVSYPQDVPPPTLRITSLRELETLAENTIAP